MKLLAALAVAAALAAPAANAAPPTYVVHGTTSFGGLGFRDTLASATTKLGKPSRVHPDGMSCYATWKQYGLSVQFFAFPPDKPCASGTVLSAVMSTEKWHTAAGLHVGAPAADVEKHHPHATLHEDGWWIVTRKTCELGNYQPYGGLAARVKGGKVTALFFTGTTCE